jgi:hypothetical protein
MDKYLYSEDAIKKMDGEVLEMPNNDINIGNLTEIMNEVINLLNYIESHKELEELDNAQFNINMENEFATFKKTHPSVFNLFIKKDSRKTNIKIFMNMISLLNNIKSNKTNHENGFDSFKEILIKQYVKKK